MTSAGQTSVADAENGWRLALIAGVLVALSAVGTGLHQRYGDLPFNALALMQGGLVIWAVALADRMNTRRALTVILLGAVALRAVLMMEHPYLSTDAFRYVWDGRVQGAGINPYRYIPAAPELSALRDTEIYPWINRADYAVTIYPPAAQMLFFLAGRLGDSLLAWRMVLIGLEVVTVVVLLDLLRRIGQPATRIVAYAWHPLVVWEIADNAHIDGAALAVVCLGIWLVAVLRRPIAGAAVFAVATLTKPMAALALPFAWKPWDWRAPAAAVAVVGLLYLPYLSVGTGMFSFVHGYLQEERLESGDAFWLVWLASQVIGPQAWLRYVYMAGAAALLLAMALCLSFAVEETTEQRLRRLGWLVFAGLYALSPGYPWYYLMIIPFVVLFGNAAFWIATVGCFLLYDVIPNDAGIAFWIRDGLFNGGMLLAALGALWPRRRPVPA